MNTIAEGRRTRICGAVQLLFVWPEPPAQARGKLKEPPPIGKLLASRPWLFLKFLNGQVAD